MSPEGQEYPESPQCTKLPGAAANAELSEGTVVVNDPDRNNPDKLRSHVQAVGNLVKSIGDHAQSVEHRPATTGPEFAPTGQPVELFPDATPELRNTLGFMRAASPDTKLQPAEMAAAVRAFQYGVEQDTLAHFGEAKPPTPYSNNRVDLEHTVNIPDSTDFLKITEIQYAKRPPTIWVQRCRPTGSGEVIERETFMYRVSGRGVLERFSQADLTQPGLTTDEAINYEQRHHGPVGLAEVRGIFGLTGRRA